MAGRNGQVKEHTLKYGVLDTKALLQVLKEVNRGNFNVRLPDDWTGIGGENGDEQKAKIQTNRKKSQEFYPVSQTGGKKGEVWERAVVSVGDGGGEREKQTMG